MPLYYERLTADELKLLSPHQTLVLVPLYAPEFGVTDGASAPLISVSLGRARAICDALAAAVESEFKDWRVLIAPPQMLWREGRARGAPGWALRDVVQGYIKTLSVGGLRWFGLYLDGAGPGGLTLLEEVGRRFKWRKIQVLSLASALHPLERVRRSPLEWTRKPSDDPPESIEVTVKQIQEPLFEMLRGAPQRNRFRTWYSVLPPNSSTFKLWLLTIFAIAAMLALLLNFMRSVDTF
jgi:hypothetical protein